MQGIQFQRRGIQIPYLYSEIKAYSTSFLEKILKATITVSKLAIEMISATNSDNAMKSTVLTQTATQLYHKPLAAI